MTKTRNVSKINTNWDVDLVMKTPRSDYSYYNSSSGENEYLVNVIVNYQTAVKTFPSKTESKVCLWHEKNDQHLIRVVRIHHLGTANIWHWVWADFPTFHWIIRNFVELLVPEQKSEDHKSMKIITEIHEPFDETLAEIFPPGQTWLRDEHQK